MKKIIIESNGKSEEVTQDKLEEMKKDYKVRLEVDESKSNETTSVFKKKDLLVEENPVAG